MGLLATNGPWTFFSCSDLQLERLCECFVELCQALIQSTDHRGYGHIYHAQSVLNVDRLLILNKNSSFSVGETKKKEHPDRENSHPTACHSNRMTLSPHDRNAPAICCTKELLQTHNTKIKRSVWKGLSGRVHVSMRGLSIPPSSLHRWARALQSSH